MFYTFFGKRIIDLISSLILIAILLPLLFLISIVLIIANNGTPFFIQARPGYKEKSFNLIKFKSMNDKKNHRGGFLPDRERITPFGRFLRRTSFDELPQLFNVLKGDMSLVGPRPLLFKYLPLYNERQRERHLVKPGITGMAQVTGRNTISWQQKFENDIYYVENISFTLDMIIILKTFFKVLKQEGVNQSENRPMMPFDGTN